jgi:hypothetical protein
MYLFYMEDRSIVPKQWHSLCYAVDKLNKNLTIVFDGKRLKGSITDIPQFNISLSRMTNSTIMFGTNQDIVNRPHIWSPTNVFNRFSGQLSDINIWSKPLSFDNLVLFTRECQSTKVLGLQPDLLDWSKIDFKNKSTEFVQIHQTKREDSICSMGDGDELKLMHYKSTFTEATLLCNAYGGNLIAPTNDMELAVIKEKLLNKRNMAGYISDTCTTRVWTGIIKSPNDTWVRVYDMVEATFPWHGGQPNGLDLQQCLSGQLYEGTLLFLDEHCLANYCALCQVPSNLKFKLRGELPELLGIEREFSNNDDSDQEMDSFQGYTNHKINRIYDQWALVEIQDTTDKVLATLQSNNVLGLKNWTYKNDSDKMKFSQVSFENNIFFIQNSFN